MWGDWADLWLKSEKEQGVRVNYWPAIKAILLLSDYFFLLLSMFTCLLSVKISVWRWRYSHIFLVEYEIHIYQGLFIPVVICDEDSVWGVLVVRILFFFVQVISLHPVLGAGISCYFSNTSIGVHCTRGSQELLSEQRAPSCTRALHTHETCPSLCNNHHFRQREGYAEMPPESLFFSGISSRSFIWAWRHQFVRG